MVTGRHVESFLFGQSLSPVLSKPFHRRSSRTTHPLLGIFLTSDTTRLDQSLDVLGKVLSHTVTGVVPLDPPSLGSFFQHSWVFR